MLASPLDLVTNPSSHPNHESTASLASGLRALYPSVSPQELIHELAGSEASDGCDLGRQEQIRRVESWLRARGLCVPKSAFNTGFVGAGAEHETFFDPLGGVAVKLTHDGRFGHCLREEGAISTPFDYLLRLAYHNELFGDDIALHGL
jgi:hypothetical protein